ncbi:hypothetical protein NRB16_18125 [Pseudomonas sp. LJDD11]|uniref:hypothetical protein n=1 Tax=Pseudomonas sp. LJDD11 TaxID=2931984 RepID=UPI00211CDBC9|nr:hypothetical protein [Pseudomonas sp. LJDD11]MCQ9425438.1 hypothetical protein [Pseudomonas sp. LJDD11]
MHLSEERIADHIDNFLISEISIEATLEWLDKGSPGWRERYREQWNARVTDRPV